MEYNIEAFKALADRYDSITLEDLKKNDLEDITGFGHITKCTLCVSLDVEWNKDCSGCIWNWYNPVSGYKYNYIFTFNCQSKYGKQRVYKTYDDICEANYHSEYTKLLKAIKQRAKLMRKVIKLYEKSLKQFKQHEI